MTLKNIAIVGGGVIGSSWALLFAMKKMNVSMYDINDDCLNIARNQIDKYMDNLVELEAMKKEEKEAVFSRISFTTDMQTAVSEAEFVQENGPERIQIKRSILAQIEEFTSEKTLIASSSSGLLISDIVAEAAHPERIVGGHPYKSPFRRLSVGGTNSNESLSILHVIDKIILKEATLQSTGR